MAKLFLISRPLGMALTGITRVPPKETGVDHADLESAHPALDPDIVRRLLAWDPSIEVGYSLQDRLHQMAVEASHLASIAEQADCEGNPLLFPIQRVGSEWLVQAKRVILADEQGVGKTVEACDAVRRIQPIRGVVICSNAKVRDWMNHLAEWADRPSAHLTGDKGKRNKMLDYWSSGFIVCNYKVATLHKARLAKADLVILDEAHKIRNRNASVTKAVRGIANHAEYAFCLTASPTVNSAVDIWPLLNICDRDRFRSFWSLAYRYHRIVDSGYGLAIERTIKEEELGAFQEILSRYVLHRPLEMDLKIKNRVVIHRLKGPQKALYDSMVSDSVAEWDGVEVEADFEVAKVTRKRQLALHPKLCFPTYEGPSKLDTLLDVVNESSSQAVVFTNYSELAELTRDFLLDQGVSAVALHGSLPDAVATAALSDFQQGDVQVLVVTHGTGGEGLNLVEAARVIYLELAWHPTGNRHARSRIIRHGQQAPEVEIVAIKSVGTIEDHIWDIVREKRAVTLEELVTYA